MGIRMDGRDKEWLASANGIRMDGRENEWLASANGIWKDDRDERLIGFGYWHPKWMTGVSERLTSANYALRG